MDLPKRPASHELATLAERKFESLLPPAWTYFPTREDYGIDGYLTPFLNQNPTGDIVGVQVKGVHESEEPESIPIVLKSTTLSAFAQAKYPVWLVVYDSHADHCYWLDMHHALVELVTARGLGWQTVRQVTFRVPRANRIEAQSLANLLEGLTDPPRVMPALLELHNRKAKGWLQRIIADSNSETEPNLEAPEQGVSSPLVVLVEGRWRISPPSLEALLALFDSETPHLVQFMRHQKWLDHFGAEETGRLLALYVARDRLPATVVEDLWQQEPQAYFEALQNLLLLAPSKCQELSDLKIESTTLTLKPGLPPSAIQHSLTFTSGEKEAAFARLAEDKVASHLELVRIGETAYIVEMERLGEMKSRRVAMVAIEGRGVGTGHNIGFRDVATPSAIRAKEIRLSFPVDQPYAICYSRLIGAGFPSLQVNGLPFSIAGGQDGTVAANGANGSLWMVDGISFVLLYSGARPEDVPDSIDGRIKVNLQATLAEPDVGVGFLLKMQREPMNPAVMDALRSRYSQLVE